MAKLVAQYTYTDAELLALWRECEAKITQGQSVDIEGLRITRADAKYVAQRIAELERKVNAVSVRPAHNYARLGGR